MGKTPGIYHSYVFVIGMGLIMISTYKLGLIDDCRQNFVRLSGRKVTGKMLYYAIHTDIYCNLWLICCVLC